MKLTHTNLEHPVPMKREEIFALISRLGRSKCHDGVGAEFLVHTRDLDMVESILTQVHNQLEEQCA